MQNYLDFLKAILQKGKSKNDRTGVGTLSLFGYEMRFDLSQGFPLLTTKKLHTRSIIIELLWFLKGLTNTDYLHQHQVSIWDEWADAEGNLGPIYGKQWRAWPTADGGSIDQIAMVLDAIRRDPNSRRHIVCSWNVAALAQMKLPPCHALFQFYVCDQQLSCKLTQRSADAFLGVPFNIASYALLTHLIAAQCDLQVGELIWSGGDCHLYCNHLDQTRLQLQRTPRPLPTLIIKRKPTHIEDYALEDFSIENYHPWPAIAAPIAV